MRLLLRDGCRMVLPSRSSLGPNGISYFRGLVATFAGAVTVDIGNALLVLLLPLVFIDHASKASDIITTDVDSTAVV